MDIKTAIAVVSGGASGLGNAVARRVVEEGGRVAILDVTEEQGRAAAEALGDAAIFVRTDVSDEAEVNAAVARAVETFGGVTLCVNCAGIIGAGRVLGRDGPMPGKFFTRVIMVNLVGSFLMSKACADAMQHNEPNDEGEFHFENRVTGGRIPSEFISSCQKGFQSMLEEGLLIGHPIQGVNVILEDGDAHAVDSSDMAFQAACRGAFRAGYLQGRPIVLEPLMLVSVEGPSEFQGDIVKTLMQRRGIIVGTTEDEGFVRINADVPLAEMFGYATVLRSSTQGKAEFTMEFSRYAPAPSEMAEQLRAEYRARREGKDKSAKGKTSE